MSSTNKFPSGLNNWTQSDKPTRTDFVTDNEIIDQNALWKDDYDAEGIVVQSGGIDAYALAKDTYDPTGSVAAAGGIPSAIQSAVSSNEGYSSYVHSKTGTVHSLTNVAGGNVIRFVATAAFNDGDTMTVNGTACTAKTIDGDLLDGGFFVTGAVVSCFLDGTTLNFKKGGASLNFKIIVVASTMLLPATDKANTIAVVSSTPLPTSGKRYYIAPFAPNVTTGISAGTLWIQVGTVGTNSFDAIRDSNKVLWISANRVLQWNGSAWQARSGYIYQGAAWQPFVPQVNIFNGGGVVNGIGTMTLGPFSGTWTTPLTIGSTTISLTAVTNYGHAAGSVGYYGATRIDLTGYTTLTVVTSSVQGSADELSVGFIADTSTETIANNVQIFSNWAAKLSFSAAGTRTLNVSALTGLYYFAMYSKASPSNHATVTQNNTSIILS